MRTRHLPILVALLACGGFPSMPAFTHNRARDPEPVPDDEDDDAIPEGPVLDIESTVVDTGTETLPARIITDDETPRGWSPIAATSESRPPRPAPLYRPTHDARTTKRRRKNKQARKSRQRNRR